MANKYIGNLLRKLFHLPYKEGFEYWVNFNEIKPNPKFKYIGKEKYKRKWEYYTSTGEFESPMVIRRSDWMLVDGYTTYKICQIANIEKVPVYFTD